jgi:hypothetical protein
MALPVPPDYTSSIPNNPFYYAQEYYVVGPYNPFIVGAGLSVDSAGTLTSVGSGGGVNSLIAGTGITVDSPAGNVTISNTGVTSLTAGTGISLTSTTGDIAISVTGLTNGTVTRINTGAGLTGGPITGVGTICLAPSGVGPTATYTNPTITVDTYGRILNASSNPALTGISVTPPLTISGTTTPTLGVNQGTTTALGVVQLSSSLTDPGSLYAATTGAVKCAYDIATQAIPKSCVTGKGALVTGTAASTPVALPVGSDGYVLTACAACATGLYWGAVPTPPAVTPNYGEFINTLSQSLGAVNVAQPMTFNTTGITNNFSLVSGSQITAAVAGVYNLQFSAQLLVTTGGGGTAEIWLSVDGTDVPNSNTQFAVKNTNEAEFAALNYLVQLNAGQYVELMWSADDIHLQLAALPGVAGPAVPSIIATIVPVGA